MEIRALLLIKGIWPKSLLSSIMIRSSAFKKKTQFEWWSNNKADARDVSPRERIK